MFNIVKKFIKGSKSNCFLKINNNVVFVRNGKDIRTEYLIFKDNTLFDNFDIKEGFLYNCDFLINYQQLKNISRDEVDYIKKNNIKEIIQNEYTDIISLSKEHIKNISYFVGKEEIRYYLNGFFIDFNKEQIVATNGQVLYIEKNKNINTKLGGDGVILRVPLIIDNVNISISRYYNVKLDYKDYIIYDTYIDADYVNYMSVYPNESCYTERQLYNINDILDEKKFNTITIDSDKLILGNIRDKATIIIHKAYNLERPITLNVKYLKNALDVVKNDRLHYSKDNERAVCMCYNDTITVLIMPIC